MTIQAIRPDFLLIRKKDGAEKSVATEAAGTQAGPEKIHEEPSNTMEVK